MMARIGLWLARPALERASGPGWQNLYRNEDRLGPPSSAIRMAVAAGVAKANGWLEMKDDTWARLTPKGRVVMAPPSYVDTIEP